MSLRNAYRSMILFHLTLYLTSLYTKWIGVALGEPFDFMLIVFSIFVLLVTGIIHYHRVKIARMIKEKIRERGSKS